MRASGWEREWVRTRGCNESEWVECKQASEWEQVTENARKWVNKNWIKWVRESDRVKTWVCEWENVSERVSESNWVRMREVKASEWVRERVNGLEWINQPTSERAIRMRVSEWEGAARANIWECQRVTDWEHKRASEYEWVTLWVSENVSKS